MNPEKTETKLTVFFDEPFWVGVFERIENGKLRVCKVTFGAEPTDAELYAFILKRYTQLQFSPAVEVNVRQTKENPKRRQRNAHKELERSGESSPCKTLSFTSTAKAETRRKRNTTVHCFPTAL